MTPNHRLRSEQQTVNQEQLVVPWRACQALLNEDQFRAYYPEGKIFFPPVKRSPAEFAALTRAAKECSRFARAVRCIDFGLYRRCNMRSKDQLLRQQLKMREGALRFQLLGTGQLGSAFKIQGLGTRAAVLKVFYHRHCDHPLFSGPYSETALGMYITARGVSNMPHIQCAAPEYGWIMSEFVNEEFESSSPAGPRWQDIGFRALDLKRREDNFIRGHGEVEYRVDYGHLTTRERKDCGISDGIKCYFPDKGKYISGERFLELMDSFPESRAKFFGELRLVKPEERLGTIERFFNYPEMQGFPVQDYFLVKLLPPESVGAVFDIMSAHRSSLVRSGAVFNLENVDAAVRKRVLGAWNHADAFLALRVGLDDKVSFSRWLEYSGIEIAEA